MFIVFDTNIWKSGLGLNSHIGAAVRFFIKQKRARVVLPYVVRLEAETHLRDDLKKYVAEVNDNYLRLLAYFGKLQEVVLPNDNDIECKVQEIFSGLGVDIIDLPFTLESATSSLIKTIHKVPPSGENNQQFKDGVIWADCVKLLQEDDVYLITEDKAFYEERDYKKGLAKNLKEEVSPSSHNFIILSSLKELLEEIKSRVAIDEALLINTFFTAYSNNINHMFTQNGFEKNIVKITEINFYATENPNILFMDYKMESSCNDVTEGNRQDAVLKISGNGKYNYVLQSFDELRCIGLELQYKLPDGTEKTSQNYFLFADSIYLGHREILYTVKYKL